MAGAFTTIVTNGVVPAYNIGPRSINGGAGPEPARPTPTYRQSTVTNATGGGGEQVFCGSSDDPFFVDLGGDFRPGRLRAPTRAPATAWPSTTCTPLR